MLAQVNLEAKIELMKNQFVPHSEAHMFLYILKTKDMWGE